MSDNDAARLERDISRTRADVDRILDALGEKLSPRNLMKEAMRGASMAPRRAASTVTSQMLHHPMPTALIGIGLAWLAASSREQKQRSNGYGERANGRSLPDEDRDDFLLYQRLHSTGGESRLVDESDEDFDRRRYYSRAALLGVDIDPSEDLAGFRSRVDAEHRGLQERVEAALSRLSCAAKSTTRRAMGAAGAVKHGVMDAAGSVKHAAGRVGHIGAAGAQRIGRAGDSMIRTGLDMSENHPLAAGAFAFAAGAAIGALAPNTAVENRMMYDRRERLSEGLKTRAAAAKEKVKTVAAGAMERAVDLAEQGTAGAREAPPQA